MYQLGKDLQPWRPIPARQIFWTGGLIAGAFVLARVGGLRLPVLSMAWFFWYFLIPGGLGWLFARALVEGRRLHVVVTSWARYALYGRHLAGGYRRPARNNPLRGRKVRVDPEHLARRPIALGNYLAAIAVLAIVGAPVAAVLTLVRSPRPAVVASPPSLTRHR